MESLDFTKNNVNWLATATEQHNKQPGRAVAMSENPGGEVVRLTMKLEFTPELPEN